MVRYRNYKFKYRDDLNRETIKNQRVYLEENDLEITPITPLFLDRVISTNLKVEGTSQKLRHILSFVRKNDLSTIGEYKVSSPYNPITETDLLKSHLREVLDVERVLCGEYFGESNLTGGFSNGDN